MGNHLSKRRTRCQFLKSRVPFFYCFVSSSQLATGVGSWQISSVFASTVFRYEGVFFGGGFFRKGWYSSLENATQTARKGFFVFKENIICGKRT